MPRPWEKKMSDRKWFKLIFKQNQPIHIGMGNYGVINETRIFIPGWTMWGALTKAYGLKKGWKGNDWNKENNKKLFSQISCFYPSFDEKNTLKPNYQKGEFYLGDIPESQFRLYFVDTLLKTAIVPISRMAKDESLHETDFILPKPKAEFKGELNSFKDSLYWIGVAHLDDKCKAFCQKGLKIHIGGDAKYGLGELELKEIKEIAENELTNDWQLNTDGNFKLNNKPLMNFLKTDGSLPFEGKIELLTEFNFKRCLPEARDSQFFVSVGSTIKSTTKKEANEIPNFNLDKGKLTLNNSNSN